MSEKNLEDKLDKIIRVVTRTELHVENLLNIDAEKRLIKLEARSKHIAYAVTIVLGLPTVAYGIVKIVQAL